MNTEHDWLVWWHDEGSGMRPVNGQDHESHVRDMTRIAWLNGAFGAADEIERLRAERDEARRERDEADPLLEELWSRRTEAFEMRSKIERLRAERDEARRKICEIESQCICDPPRSPQKYASLFGWDCFKENTND